VISDFVWVLRSCETKFRYPKTLLEVSPEHQLYCWEKQSDTFSKYQSLPVFWLPSL
jgi:hypothetical protein